MLNSKKAIAEYAAQTLQNGDVVNLGIGIPTLVADYIPATIRVFIHSENGILGVGPTPDQNHVNPNLVNAGKLPVTVEDGASFFDSASSFAMIRGGHIDVSILGALEVDELGRIANWSVPEQAVLGVGGAMDLLEGSKKVIVTTLHMTKHGKSKIVRNLSYPKTSERKVDLIITDLAVFQVDEAGLLLVEIADNVTIEEIIQKTDATFRVRDGDLM